MSSVNPVFYWLAGFVALGAALLLVKDEKLKPRIIDVLLIVATIFVGQHLWHALDPNKAQKSSTAPVIDSDKAELSLKMAQGLEATSQVFLTPKIVDRRSHSPLSIPAAGTAQSSEKSIEALKREAQRIVGELVQKNPQAGVLESKYALITHDLGDPNSMSLERLSHIDSPNAKSLHKAMTVLYGTAKPTTEEVNEAENTFKTLLPRGWYRDTALLELYKKTGRKAELQALQTQVTDQGLRLVYKLVAIGCIMIFSFFVGVIVILAQLFFLPRNVTKEADRALIASPIAFSPRTIYGVFIAWMTTQVLLSSLLQTGVKVGELMNRGVFLAAITMAVLYLAANGPGIFYIWLVAAKPYKLNLFETVKLRTRVGKLGPVRMVLAGWLTWFAAVPVVLVCYLLAIKLMNSQGSSNPVIALVMEASRSADFASIIMFYFTLGVFAPICEETLFRGFLYTSLRRYWGVMPSLLLTAFLFAGVHLDGGGFLPLFGLGFLFGFIVERTKSIVPSMVAHGLWNSGTFTLVLLLFGN
ncbi:MAG: CPBP family intramembrane metalloprotease [Cyanobacteria bacterium SZAS-4]|nr:CPBP family intramembrane metalloprotease [Cyanobacteria bacterium SZAS-4]